ncbi:MAG: hypothetical protein R3E58_17495 [Phycisphaerae bacterium]
MFDDLGELDVTVAPEKQLEVVEEALKHEEGLSAQTDELPAPHPHLQSITAQLSRSARTFG